MISAPLSRRQTCSRLGGGALTVIGGALDIPEGGESEPQQENKLEGVVEGEPVDNAEQALQEAAQNC
jgi:hypothetical protein